VRLTLADVVLEVRVILGLVRLHEVPPFWKSPTVPANPLTDVTRIADVPEEPTLTINATGLAAIVKSWTLIEKFTE
jgi:hypothetical protein